jgi:phage/plasmid-associated DNA primase
MTNEDAELLQLYVGQCLIGRNLSQNFLLLTGTPGGGKSTLCNAVEALIGRHNCTELRLEHMGLRFELQRLVGKTLLTAKDVKSNFLNSAGAYKLKSLVGNDTMTIESKNRNDSADINGIFNAIITCNNNLRVAFDGDEDAWRRRILWIKYNNPPPKEKIVDFDKKLLNEEGSGILNWAIEGANKLMKLNGKIPIGKEQKARIDDLLLESNAINVFVDDCVKPMPASTVTCSDLLVEFTKYCKFRQWENLPERVFQRNLPDIMLHKFNAVKRTDIKNKHNKYNRGYAGFKLITVNSSNSEVSI